MNQFYQSLPFLVAISLLIVGAFRMQPLKDNRPWRRCLSVAVGVAFIVWGLVSIGTGHITVWRRSTQTYFAVREPLEFWLSVTVVELLGVVCVYRGFKGLK
jgi:hypothetical protein